jgi:hypothetical protein
MSFSALPLLTLPGLTGTGGATDYPSEDDVRDGVEYDFGSLVGNLTLPAERYVLYGITYGAEGTEFTGSYAAPPSSGVAVPSQSSPCALIFSLIRARVAAGLGRNVKWVRLVASDKYKVTIAEPLFCYVQVFKPNPQVDSGSGRLARTISRFFRCYLYTRSGIDSYGADTLALLGTDASAGFDEFADSRGHLLAEELLYNALDDWSPTITQSGRQVMLTIEPVHTTERNLQPERKPEESEGLVRSAIDFEVRYNLSIDRREPAP